MCHWKHDWSRGSRIKEGSWRKNIDNNSAFQEIGSCSTNNTSRIKLYPNNFKKASIWSSSGGGGRTTLGSGWLNAFAIHSKWLCSDVRLFFFIWSSPDVLASWLSSLFSQILLLLFSPSLILEMGYFFVDKKESHRIVMFPFVYVSFRSRATW